MINAFPNHPPVFKAWIKFKDGDTGVFPSRETWFTQSQVLYRKEFVIDYQKGYQLLIQLLERKFKKTMAMARIYYVPGNQIVREYRDGKLITCGDPEESFWTNELPPHVVKSTKTQKS